MKALSAVILALRAPVGLGPTLNTCTLYGTESIILVLEFTRDGDELRAQALPGFHKASRGPRFSKQVLQV